MSAIIQGLLHCWAKNRDYAARLVGDLTDEQMVLQPAPANQAGANHPAWVLSHLNVYHPVIEAVIQGVEFEDPKDHEFGMLSKPESNLEVYPPRDQLLQAFLDGHDRVADLLGQADSTVFENSIRLPRWEAVMPVAGLALPYLMCNHENMHLGQVSAWRRIQGMPSV